MAADWPADADGLIAAQARLAAARAGEPWVCPERPRVAGCWVCFPRGVLGPGNTGDPMWAAAVVTDGRRSVEEVVATDSAAAPYTPGLLALRVGRIMDQAVRRLAAPPDVLLIDATGRDHPRRAGLALHLGAVLDLPTIGVTHRPLLGTGDWPPDERGARSPIAIGQDVVAEWLRTRAGTRPLAVHPGWRVDLDTAVDVVLRASARYRTPEPLRRARQVARRARAAGAT